MEAHYVDLADDGWKGLDQFGVDSSAGTRSALEEVHMVAEGEDSFVVDRNVAGSPDGEDTEIHMLAGDDSPEKVVEGASHAVDTLEVAAANLGESPDVVGQHLAAEHTPEVEHSVG
jgi:hypothetical protein